MSALLYGLRQKLIAPARRWFWRRKSQPFVFRASGDRALRLIPGEYIDGEIFVHGAYEYRLLKLVGERLCGGIYIDVGANIGNHALYLAGNFDKVICFEPNPPIVARLRENIALSGRSNIVVHEVGLGAENGVLPFHRDSGGNAGGGTFVGADFAGGNTLPIRIGDQILAKCGPITLIKVDVEGFEPFVFRGLRRTIAKHRPMVIFEYDGCNPDARRWQQIVDCLPAYRFAELAGIAGSGARKLVSALRDGVETRLLEFARPTQKFYETIIAFPSDETAAAFGLSATKSSCVPTLPKQPKVGMGRGEQLASNQLPCRVINLDSRPDRLGHITEQFERIGLTFERVPGVDMGKDGAVPEAALIPPHCDGRAWLRSEIGTLLSHVRIWLEIADGPHPFVGIFEDDVLFTDNIAPVLRGDFPPDADIVKLETYLQVVYLSRRSSQLHRSRGEFRRLRSAHLGAAAYILSRSAAAKLRNSLGSFNLPIDAVLFSPALARRLPLIVYQMIPAPAIQGMWMDGLRDDTVMASDRIREAPPDHYASKRGNLGDLAFRAIRRIWRQMGGRRQRVDFG